MQFMIYLLHLLFECINQADTRHYHHWSRPIKLKNFHKYPLTKIIKTKNRFGVSSNASNHDECLRSCTSAIKCASLNAIQQLNDTYTCEYFSTADGHLLQKEGSTFYTKYAPRCTGYCEQLSYLPLCASCKCSSLCDSKLSHFCDCTDVLETSAKNCSEALLTFGDLPTSGIYHVDSGKQTVIVMCQFFKYNVVKTLWVALYRRFHILTTDFNRSRSDYIEGFNKPYQDDYIMSYRRIVDFTNTNVDMTLGIYLVTLSNEEEYAEYDNFKFALQDDESYKATYSQFCCNYCTRNFYSLRNDNHDRSCPEYDLLKVLENQIRF